jgi:hypothetical protein
MVPLAARIVQRFLSASALHWRTVEDTDDRYLEETHAPNGWKYQIVNWKGYGAKFDASVWRTPGKSYSDAYLTKDGIEQRSGTRTELPSLEVARAAVVKHYAAATAEKETDPDKIIPKLTPAQKALILEAFENGGSVPADYGTKSERPLRQLRTRLIKQLEPMGIFDRLMYLEPLGKEIAQKLK